MGRSAAGAPLRRLARITETDVMSELLSVHVNTIDEALSTMAALWADTLTVSQVGFDDDFATLGGSSMEAIVVTFEAQRVSPQFFSRLEPAMVLEHKSLRSLVAACLGVPAESSP